MSSSVDAVASAIEVRAEKSRVASECPDFKGPIPPFVDSVRKHSHEWGAAGADRPDTRRRRVGTIRMGLLRCFPVPIVVD